MATEPNTAGSAEALQLSAVAAGDDSTATPPVTTTAAASLESIDTTAPAITTIPTTATTTTTTATTTSPTLAAAATTATEPVPSVSAPALTQDEYDRQIRELINSANFGANFGADPTLQSSLQAISDFNRAHDEKAHENAVTAADIEAIVNEWGKRPAEDANVQSPAKRTQLDNTVNAIHQNVLEDEFDEEDDADDPYENGVSVDPAWSAPASMDPNSYLLWDANQNLRVASLPILDNLSTQILQTLGKGPYQETLNIVTQPESDQGQAYGALKTLFDQTKKLYTQEAFLNADELKLDSPEQRSTVRKVNLATFVSSVFGSQEVGFFHLNECFLDTFVPDGGRLLKSQGALYLDLKTQAYISAMSTNERPREDILSDLFPDDMEEHLKARRPGTKQLTPSEADFVSRAQKRKQHLLNLPPDTPLSEKYVWQDFLKDVSYYVCKNYETIVAQPQIKKQRKIRNPQMPRPLANYPPPESYNTIQAQPQQPQTHHEDFSATAAALSAHNAGLSAESQQMQTTVAPTHHVSEPTTMFSHAPAASGMAHSGMAHSLGTPPVAQPPMIQSAPTAVLYERARLAATAKSSPNARRAGLPSQRRPWTTEEENALMAGLDRVKGPHWSQILAMFGPGGTVNEVLKDRNQVQLKDKARNLKLFFLKSGIEVPYYLQFVTGELKTRAPSQAMKQQSPTPKPQPPPVENSDAHLNALNALNDAHRRLEASGGQFEDITQQAMMEQTLQNISAQMEQQMPSADQQTLEQQAQQLIDSGALDTYTLEQQVKEALASEGIGQSAQQLTA